jgi:hypothetical protein
VTSLVYWTFAPWRRATWKKLIGFKYPSVGVWITPTWLHLIAPRPRFSSIVAVVSFTREPARRETLTLRSMPRKLSPPTGATSGVVFARPSMHVPGSESRNRKSFATKPISAAALSSVMVVSPIETTFAVPARGAVPSAFTEAMTVIPSLKLRT